MSAAYHQEGETMDEEEVSCLVRGLSKRCESRSARGMNVPEKAAEMFTGVCGGFDEALSS
jgi:hypothetical protein